jgi:class 3 adenylate cyclase
VDETGQRLFSLIDRWADTDGDDTDEVERQIRAEFEQTCAILVIDTKGFSRSVHRDGVLSFLARISHMRQACVPHIERRGGTFVKYVADDIVAVFDGPDAALTAGLEMVDPAFGEDPAHPFSDFELSIGIGFGPVFHVPGADLWGDQMNRAFKLGEEVANGGEVMVTDEAWDALGNPPRGARRQSYRVSGLDLVAHVLTSGNV